MYEGNQAIFEPITYDIAEYVLEDPPHFAGYPGQKRHRTALVLHEESRCTPERVGQHSSPVRHLGLRQITRRKVRKATGSKPFTQIVDDQGIGTEVEAQEIRYGRPRQVVAGRPESPGHDDQFGHIESCRKRGLNRLGVVPYDPPPNDGRTEGRQLSTQPRPVRICRLTGEKLFADGDYGSLNLLVSGHESSIPEAQQTTVGP